MLLAYARSEQSWLWRKKIKSKIEKGTNIKTFKDSKGEHKQKTKPKTLIFFLDDLSTADPH